MKIIQIIISLSIFAWCMGFFYFIKYTNNISNENRNITESIVVYGGNKERLYVGAQLLKLGYAPIVFVTGDKPRKEYENFIKSNNIIQEQFLFDKTLANNKLSPINDVLAFLKRYQFHSVRVVLNATQIPRAKLEFAAKVPREIILIPHAVSKKGDKSFKVFIEYLKYNIMLFASFMGTEDDFDLSYS